MHYSEECLQIYTHAQSAAAQHQMQKWYWTYYDINQVQRKDMSYVHATIVESDA